MLPLNNSKAANTTVSHVAHPDKEEFIKLKYKITFKDWKINVVAVLFLRNDTRRSEFNLPGKLLDRLMEYTARDWIENYIKGNIRGASRNAEKLNENINENSNFLISHINQDSKEFIARINKNGGVVRSEFVAFLAEAKFKGVSLDPKPVAVEGKKLTLRNVDKIIIDHLNGNQKNKYFDSKIFQSYMNYVNLNNNSGIQDNYTNLKNFVSAFRVLATQNADSSFVKLNAGRVNMLIHELDRHEKYRLGYLDDVYKDLIRTKSASDPVIGVIKIFKKYEIEKRDRFSAEQIQYWLAILPVKIAESKNAKADGILMHHFQKNTQKIFEEMLKEVLSQKNMPDPNEILDSLSAINFNQLSIPAGSPLYIFWSSCFNQFCLHGSRMIDHNSFSQLKKLADFSSENQEVVSKFMKDLGISDGEISIIQIYLKKLAADMSIFESNLYIEG